MSTPRLLTIMGSGETSPTMVTTHKDLFTRLGPGAVSALVIDTPYGFQENADDLAARAVEYFRESVGREIGVAGFRARPDDTSFEFESMLARIKEARYLFAGPGSPTYSLRQWRGTPLPDLLREKLSSGGGVTFASAAALTLGVATVPVYEIYKCGMDPWWEDGLDLLSAIGLPVAVIPHYNNAEGGNHDTRFCYLGERRLAMLEKELPDGAFVLGIDEHTGLVLDLDADTAMVVGNGVVTVRRNGSSVEYPSGTIMPTDRLRFLDSSAVAVVAAPVADVVVDEVADGPSLSLGDDTVRCQKAFDAAMAAGDASAATAAVLELEAALVSWSRDTLQSDQADRARAAVRSMIVRLGEAAHGGLRDPREAVGPYVEALLAVRAAVRAEKNYAMSDLIRDRLVDAGVEVRDTPAGVVWELAG
ncbi:MAG: hypothetical protein AB7L13_02340 [Acidimicrobiia bacterium]